MSTELIEDVKVTVEVTDDGDHDRFAHYFRKEDIDKAWLDGAEITALCGKKDKPTREVGKYPVCPSCKEIYETLKD